MSSNRHNLHRRQFMRCTLTTGTAMLAGPATAASAIIEPTTTSAPVDIAHLADRLAAVLRYRLPSGMVGELLSLPQSTLQTALASHHDAASTAALFHRVNGSLGEALQAVELHCESDCLAGRMILMKTWLACRTEVLVAHWYAQSELPAVKRQAWLDSPGG